PAFDVPLLVLPVGAEDRQPRLTYETGTATTRARVELTWPYVAGPDARGDVTLRYFADVAPGASPFGDALLGGAVLRSYFGVRLDHALYTARGAGDLVVDLPPRITEPGVWATAHPVPLPSATLYSAAPCCAVTSASGSITRSTRRGAPATWSSTSPPASTSRAAGARRAGP